MVRVIKHSVYYYCYHVSEKDQRIFFIYLKNYKNDNLEFKKVFPIQFKKTNEKNA